MWSLSQDEEDKLKDDDPLKLKKDQQSVIKSYTKVKVFRKANGEELEISEHPVVDTLKDQF